MDGALGIRPVRHQGGGGDDVHAIRQQRDELDRQTGEVARRGRVRRAGSAVGAFNQPDNHQHNHRADGGVNDSPRRSAPPIGTISGSNQVARKAPTMPTTMLPIRPKPTPLTIKPASQPATAPTIRMMMSASSPCRPPVVGAVRAAPVQYGKPNAGRHACQGGIGPGWPHRNNRQTLLALLARSTILTTSDMMRLSSKSFGV